MNYKINIETYEIGLENEVNGATFTFDFDSEISVIKEKFEREFGPITLENSEIIMEEIENFLQTNDEDNYDFKIKHWVTNRSYGELADMFELKEITIPNMQRGIVWTPQQCSLLIESILIGLPVPPIFMAEVDEEKYEVIDGLQRLTAISNFILGRPWGAKIDEVVPSSSRASSLSGNIKDEYKRKNFSQLTTDQQKKIKRSTIPLIEFKQLSPDNLDAKYFIFARLNSGAVKLSDMQIRRSLINSKFMDEIFGLADDEKINDFIITKFTKAEVRSNLFEELVLRGLTLYLFSEGKIGYHKSMRKFIDEGTKYAKNNSEFYASKIRKSIMQICLLNQEYDNKLLDNIKVNEGHISHTNRINKSIFDAMLAALLIEEVEVNNTKLLANYDKYLKRVFEKPLEDNYFAYATNNEAQISNRVKIMKEVIDDSRI